MVSAIYRPCFSVCFYLQISGVVMNIIELANESCLVDYGMGKDRARFIHRVENFAHLVAAATRADEREECAREVEEFARKWWSIHCHSNKHAETTRKAHDDFCALQAAIRRRGKTE